MTESSHVYLPTLQQLLETEVMAEAHVLVGQQLQQRHISQIISSLGPASKARSLLITRANSVGPKDRTFLSELSGVLVVGHNVGVPPAQPQTAVGGGAVPLFPSIEPGLAKLTSLCEELGLPLIALPEYAEFEQVTDEVRNAFLKEMRNSANHLNSLFLKIVLSEGLEGLVEDLSNRLARPTVFETATFQVLAAQNMGATPPNQQHVITEQVRQSLDRLKKTARAAEEPLTIPPMKVGRRLVVPVMLDDDPVGYLSAMMKANDSVEFLAEYLQPAAVTAAVDFYQRRNDGAIFTVTQKSLLKDLLSGRSLSAADQERLERHYGFDLCDGLFVFAVSITSGQSKRTLDIYDETIATTEVEGTRIIVVPFNEKDNKTWQQIAEELKERLRKNIHSRADLSDVKIQCGTSRLAPNILSLAEAYREARQALVVGAMNHGDTEFTTSYGDLGIKRLLYLMIDHPELQRFYEENLDPLESYDEEWESELVPSLRVYLDQGANLNSAARELFIHRHTLRYRLEQIADILKVDIDQQEVLLNLQIAFLIRDMKHGIEAKPAP